MRPWRPLFCVVGALMLALGCEPDPIEKTSVDRLEAASKNASCEC